MESIKKFYKENVKSFFGAVIGALIVRFTSWTKGEEAWPQTGEEWRNVAIGAVIAAVAVWLPTNKITQKQLDNDKYVQGGIVVSDPVVSAPKRRSSSGSVEFRNKWEDNA